jgi:predicted aspartyl protease
MGVFYVDCTVENMASRDKSASIAQLLVDSGSEFTWLPGDALEEIEVGVQKRDEQFVMANGGIITRDVGYAILRVNGFETVDEIVFAREGDLNLLGSRTLEGFGAIVDARGKRLVAAGPHLAASCSATCSLRVDRSNESAS